MKQPESETFRPWCIFESPLYRHKEEFVRVRVVGRFEYFAQRDAGMLVDSDAPFGLGWVVIVFYIFQQVFSMAMSDHVKLGVVRQKSLNSNERIVSKEVIHGREEAIACAKELTQKLATEAEEVAS